ncbi:MAG: response regulator transcription factor [Candidatus Binatia bacterium]
MPPDGFSHPGAAPLRVLIVEDDPVMAVALRDGFTYEGCTVLTAADGVQGLRLARESEVDVIILDVMLPAMSGLDVCARLREARDDVPIIMLTARGQETDKVHGLSIGADDYVTKPFSFLELLARVRAAHRRAPRPAPPERYAFGDVILDFARLRATRAGTPIALSPREFNILALLISRRGEVVTREELLKRVWGYRRLPFTRTVDMHIAKLRRKIEPDPGAPRYIATIHGVGYKFVA